MTDARRLFQLLASVALVTVMSGSVHAERGGTAETYGLEPAADLAREDLRSRPAVTASIMPQEIADPGAGLLSPTAKLGAPIVPPGRFVMEASLSEPGAPGMEAEFSHPKDPVEDDTPAGPSPAPGSPESPTGEAPAPVPDRSVSDAPAPERTAIDHAALQSALEAYRKGDVAEGDRLSGGIDDPAARTVMEWVAIRSGAAVGFERIMAFLRERPDWPSSRMLRRRAEDALVSDRKPASVVRAFFATEKPMTPAGTLVLARALKADGLDRDAAGLIRALWRETSFSRDFETRVLDEFGDALTRADHRARMEYFLFRESWENARRAASRAGKDYAALVKARQAVVGRSKKAQAAIDAVPASLRSDPSYLFTKAQHLRRQEKAGEAAKLIADLPRDADLVVDGDEWWVERRLIARALLDGGDARAAYDIVRGHVAESDGDRIEAEFHAGWIALRFLKNPTLAAGHFTEAGKSASTPISLARVAYWQGRAAEDAGQAAAARGFYESAADQSFTYYGQLARAKLGLTSLPLRKVASGEDRRAAFADSLPVRALKLLHQTGLEDLAVPLGAELSAGLKDPVQIAVLAEIAAEHKNVSALLAVGKTAVQRGLPLEVHAYPTMGIPAFEPVGDPVERAMIFAIARQESAFNPRAQSSAGARGLMQLMPATAKRTATRFGLNFNLDRLIEDPSYNAAIGSAHLGELMEDWKGSYILAFASYNAGGGNVKKWIDAYGDPRKPDTDPIDWVERIPFSETRNYVQRVMENFQVYRHVLGERSALLIDEDLRRGGVIQ